MNSPLAFFAISWCAVVTMILLSLTLSQGMTYYVGYAPVYLSGKLTWFGLYYELLTPRLAFAIFSTALIALYLFKPIRL